MRTSADIQREIDDTNAELDQVMLMSEKEVIYKYNVDEKNEAVTLIKEDLESLDRELEEAVMNEHMFDYNYEVA